MMQSIFPDVNTADEDGFLAYGGDLSLEVLLDAYSHGIFPWYSKSDPICWYAPAERCVVFPEKLKISKSMHQFMRKTPWRISKNEAFEQVIQGCAHVKRKEEAGTWIHTEMQQAYIALHHAGYAHSIEVWQDKELLGGLYGIEINHLFCGESMFSLRPNASKWAFIDLCLNHGYKLIDCQLPNPHLMSLGAENISRASYMDFLAEEIKMFLKS